jgi:hypothetical protein
MDYQTWRNLVNISGNVEIIETARCFEIVNTDNAEVFTFTWDDCSFGTFLMNKFQQINKLKQEKDEENSNMKNFVNFDFGPIGNNDYVRMSIYGIAVKNANNTFVSYDVANQTIMDVDVFNFDGGKFLYKMPVAIKDIQVGDIVIHAHKPMFVTEILADSKSLKVVDPVSGEKKEIILTRSPFGFDFATKIVNFLGNVCGNAAASAENPFGNLWMLMLMDEGSDMNNILPFMMMNQGAGNIDPMMMFALMGNKGNDNLLPFLMMTNFNKNAGQKDNT